MEFNIKHTFDNLSPHFSGVKNAVKSFCSELGLCREMKRVSNSLYGSIMARPVGIVSKNYDFIRATLKRNIGSGIYEFDGYGTPISALADVEKNSGTIPSFLNDLERNRYDNYLGYIDSVYFNGYMQPSNFVSPEEKAKYFNFASLLLEENRVGLIRNYNIDNSNLAVNMFANGAQSNPNNYSDTRLGIINNFYLNATMQTARLYGNTSGSYQTIPKDINGNEILTSSITQGGYNLFGFFGQKGMVNGEYTIREGAVVPQGELTDYLISTTPLNGEFGSYDSLQNSSEFISYAGHNTQQFIYKSLYGFDLLNTKDVIYDDSLNHGFGGMTNKWFLPKKNKSYLNYAEDLSDNTFSSVGFDLGRGDTPIRYKIVNAGNGHSVDSRQLYVYAESEYQPGSSPYETEENRNSGVEYYVYSAYDNVVSKQDIISYTNDAFLQKKYDTLIARFHSDETQERDMLSSAVSQYGMSHGRNLLKANHRNSMTNGYSDPYCRVWTFHKQYHRLLDTIRPFYDDNGSRQDLSKTVLGCKYQPNRKHLDEYGVKGKNGLVRFSPVSEEGVSSIKRCMFSIENLAWKKESIDKTDQIGPLGGRIMWFPPYGLSFQESVNVDWNPTKFIGRGENIYTYTNTERSGTLSFKLLIDHPSLLNEWRTERKSKNGVDDVDSTEQKILRFFAGCEVLDACGETKPTQKRTSPQPSKPESQPIMLEDKSYDEVNFYVFFPNNYSGVDDIKPNSKTNPIHYLVNGIGCQYIENTNDKGEDFGTSLTEDGIGYEMDKELDEKSKGISGYFTKYKDYFNYGGVKHIKYKAKNENGGTNEWGYRVDKWLSDEVFINTDSYLDTTLYGLNSSGFTKLVNYHTDAKDLLDKGTLFSFKSIFSALESNSGKYTTDDTPILKDLFDKYEVYSVEVQGCASGHGHTEKNNKLNEDRAKTIINWLNNCNPTKFNKSKCKIVKTKIGPKLSHNNASDITAKVWRCAKVTIKLEKTDIVDTQNTSYNENEVIRVRDDNGMKIDILNNSDDVTQSQLISTQSAKEYSMQQAEKDSNNANNSCDSSPSDGNMKRYGNEHEFFEELKENVPFLHGKIVDKIKYFDPAYHSITPEGFNARLTFLHQCTRQGSTVSASSTKSNRTASNLSFGAPPICVLRIGDFYNTKIIIDSITISYDDLTWDLNDEGIGVMPMIADVNIGFKFIGGSDLAGPITRLQNAVSFNYYANTSVYDDRADTVKYDDNGNISEYNAKF